MKEPITGWVCVRRRWQPPLTQIQSLVVLDPALRLSGREPPLVLHANHHSLLIPRKMAVWCELMICPPSWPEVVEYKRVCSLQCKFETMTTRWWQIKSCWVTYTLHVYLALYFFFFFFSFFFFSFSFFFFCPQNCPLVFRSLRIHQKPKMSRHLYFTTTA